MQEEWKDKLQEDFLNVQSQLLKTLSEMLPEEHQEIFLLFWIDKHAKDFRQIYLWIEMHKGIKMELHSHHKTSLKDLSKDILIAMAMLCAILLYLICL